MAQAYELLDRRSSENRYQQDGQFEATYTRVYTVQDSVSITEADVLTAPGLPGFGDGHPDNFTARVLALAPQQVDGTDKVWECTVSYSTLAPPETEDENEAENPFAKPVDISYRSTKITLPVEKDIHDDPIVNTALKSYDPPLERQYTLPTIVFVKNEPTFNWSTAFQYTDKTNSVEIGGASPGTVLCDISAQNKFTSEIEYWEVTYEFTYDPRGWDPDVLEQGTQQLDGGQHIPCEDKNGSPVTEPVPLDAVGVQVPPSSLPGAAKFTNWEIYERVDFNDLSLPFGT